MNILTLILIIVIIYLIYRIHQSTRAFTKQYILTVEYIRLLFLLLDDKEGTQEDLRKQIWRSWSYDGAVLTTGEFNKKWISLCEACNVHPILDQSNYLSSEIIDGIVHSLYLNKHILESLFKGYPKSLTIENLKWQDLTPEERRQHIRLKTQEKVDNEKT